MQHPDRPSTTTSLTEPAMVVFDMAGTVVQEYNLVYRTLTDIVTEAGFPIELDRVLRLAAGMEKQEAIRTILLAKGCETERTMAVTSQIYAVFRQRLRLAYAEERLEAQPGADKLFAFLRARGIGVYLNTGYDRRTAEQLLDRLGWRVGSTIDGLVTASDAEEGRPSSDMIDLVAARAGLSDAGRIMKVGDSVIDLEEGRNAGCGWVIGITTGAHDRERLEGHGADAVVDDLLSLRRYWRVKQ